MVVYTETETFKHTQHLTNMHDTNGCLICIYTPETTVTDRLTSVRMNSDVLLDDAAIEGSDAAVVDPPVF